MLESQGSHTSHRITAIGVLSLALAVSGAAVTVLQVAPAQAATCPASGGAAIAPVAPKGLDTDVVFRGGGWGHGLGMSQYGAQGAARLGCSAEEILARYYAGTQVVAAAMPTGVRLRILDNGTRVDVEAVQGALTWTLDGCVPPPPPTPIPPPSTPASTPTPTPAPTPAPLASPACPPVQPPGARWQVHLDATGTRFDLVDVTRTTPVLLWESGSASAPLRLLEYGSVARLTSYVRSTRTIDRWVRWDTTAFTIDAARLDAARLDAVQQFEDTAAGTAMDKYLWGIAEVPATFPAAALQAQAIAARTYAAKRTGRVLMPTPLDQNWLGWRKETEGPNGAYGLLWKAAVDATAGKVIASAATGTMIDAFYSSSTGGFTEDERYVWGPEAPYLRAVDDSAWDLASDNPVGNRSWARGVSWETLAARLGFTSISSISVPARGDAARVAGVRVVGVRGGRVLSTYVRGWDLRQALGLLSPGFTVTMRRTGGRAAQPLVGDWDGDGKDSPGLFRDGQVALAMTGPVGAGGASGRWTKRFRYGGPGDVAVVGDWDRDGRDDLGVFRNGTWLLRPGLTAGAPTRVVRFGRTGDVPVVGSWTGRRTGLGVFRSGRWLLRRTLSSGPAQRRFRFGAPGDVPVIGSWDGGPRSGIGVERGGQWLLRDSRAAGPPTRTVAFGVPAAPGDRYLVADVDGDRIPTPTVVRRARLLVRSGLGADESSRTIAFPG